MGSLIQDWLTPGWPAPATVKAATTLRAGGVSSGSCASLNLATHVGDDPAAVAENRRRLREALKLPAEPFWLEQVHGTRVVKVSDSEPNRRADAVIADEPGRVCVVMTADCLPVLFASADGKRVAAAHAGWRGLASGVLEQTITALDVPPRNLLAWLGPAISQDNFEVGPEVRDAFMQIDPAAASAFVSNHRGRYQADLYLLARQHLNRAGISAIYGGGRCTFREKEAFFSHRRDPHSGRIASLIWST